MIELPRAYPSFVSFCIAVVCVYAEHALQKIVDPVQNERQKGETTFTLPAADSPAKVPSWGKCLEEEVGAIKVSRRCFQR